MAEKGDKWKVQLGSNKVIVVSKVRMNKNQHGVFESYTYDNINPNRRCVIKYWPICMKFHLNAIENWQYMINRLALKNGKVILQLSS